MAAPRRHWKNLLVANLAPLAALALAGIGHYRFPDRYFLALQEDRFAEWLTFWSFAAAAICFGLASLRCRRHRSRTVWFLVLMAVSCLFIAGEEVSWGQRVLGFSSPEYFLEENFQQEVNVHNVFSTTVRKAGLKSVILGFGVLLPWMAVTRVSGGWLARWGVFSPPWELIPSFLAMFVLYQIYPWKFSGEVVELMLGLTLLVSALSTWDRSAILGDWPVAPTASRVGMAASLVVVLGVSSAAASSHLLPVDPMKIEAARLETDALRADIREIARGEGDLAAGTCGLHKRLYSFVEKYGKSELREGSFADLVRAVSSVERARFFIDPWNTPYWIRHTCDRDGSDGVVLIYSLGPNRMRDSTRDEIRGDDVGAMLTRARLAAVP